MHGWCAVHNVREPHRNGSGIKVRGDGNPEQVAGAKRGLRDRGRVPEQRSDPQRLDLVRNGGVVRSGDGDGEVELRFGGGVQCPASVPFPFRRCLYGKKGSDGFGAA